MKVSLYDEMGQCVDVAWHEDNEGTVTFPPATRPVVLTHFTINDGPKIALGEPVLMPLDSDFTMAVWPSRSALRRHFAVDSTATKVTWWSRVKEALSWTW